MAENIKKTKPIKRTPCADDAGPSGSIQPKKKTKKRRMVRQDSSSSEYSDEKMSLASSTEDLILAGDKV